MTDLLDSLSYLHQKPATFGTLKAEPSHFFVSETLSFTPKGEGEHFLVRIRKKGENTQYVANELAKACGVPSRDVSWAGLKDRHAITEQWFSVHLPGKSDPDLNQFVEEHDGVEAILASTRHDKKLRPGDLIGNDFTLILSTLENTDTLEARLEAIKSQGVPNYFGSQRFGRGGNNLVMARQWGQNKLRVKDKNKRSFYLSAARAYLFNLVLDARIKDNLLYTPLLGDLLINTKKETLLVEDIEQAKTLLACDNLISENIAPTENIAPSEWLVSAPLTGDNALPTNADAQAFEQSIIDQEPDLLAIIRANRMQHDRRPLLLMPKKMSWQIKDDELTLSFSLPAGSFATALVRELIQPHLNGDTYAHIDQ